MLIYSRAVEEPNQLVITNSGHLTTEAKLSQGTSNIPRIGGIMNKF